MTEESKKLKKKKRKKLKRQRLTLKEKREAKRWSEYRITMPITNVRVLSDEEVEELRRQGLID